MNKKKYLICLGDALCGKGTDLLVGKLAENCNYVSDYAKEFQKNEDSYAKHAVIECSNWFFGLAGIFGHYAFFTQKMWKQVPGFEDTDEGEIIAVFLHWWFRDRYGFQSIPCGAAWSTEYPTTYRHDDELYNDYINRYQPVLKAYSDWCEAQR